MYKGTRAYGQKGEDVAQIFLRSKGYKIIERNYLCKLGEIDIVALDGATLTIIEVKMRSSRKYGTAVEAVGFTKMQKLRRPAEYYSVSHPLLPKKIRIDVVAIDIVEEAVTCRLIKVGP